METKQHATKKQWSMRKSKGKFKKFLEKNDNENTTFQIYGMLQKQFFEKSSQQYSPPQETRKSSNKQPKFTSKAAQERRTDKT